MSCMSELDPLVTITIGMYLFMKILQDRFATRMHSPHDLFQLFSVFLKYSSKHNNKVNQIQVFRSHSKG